MPTDSDIIVPYPACEAHPGLGGVQSPPDDRDYPIAQLYATAGIELAALAPPASYMVSPLPAISNQGTTPMCVAHSEAYEKLHQDLIDQGPAFEPDRSGFFYAIGGGPNGAVGRNGLSRMLNHGYDVVGGDAAAASKHKIAAYYSVPVTRADIEAAIYSFGGVLFGVRWPHSWFHPLAGGVLPKPDYDAGGHFIYAVGYDLAGVWLLQSWGLTYGVSGKVKMPWAYLDRVFEAWKAVDVIDVATKKTACSGGYFFAGPGATYAKLAANPAGSACGVLATVGGGAWAFTCGTTRKSGSSWYKITMVNGRSAQSLYGHPYVYAATGRF